MISAAPGSAMSTRICWPPPNCTTRNCGPATSGSRVRRSGSGWPTLRYRRSAASRWRAALVGDATEFVPRIPVRPGLGLRQRAPEAVEQRQVVDHAGPVPVGIVFVVGQVIGPFAIGRFPRRARGAATGDEILAAVDVEHRHPAL